MLEQVVSGKQFVVALRTLITDFGNVDDKFLAKVYARAYRDARPKASVLLRLLCAGACSCLHAVASSPSWRKVR